jgi:hypothetical protein
VETMRPLDSKFVFVFHVINWWMGEGMNQERACPTYDAYVAMGVVFDNV